MRFGPFKQVPRLSAVADNTSGCASKCIFPESVDGFKSLLCGSVIAFWCFAQSNIISSDGHSADGLH